MGPEVTVTEVGPRVLAAVRRKVALGEVGRSFGPALDVVWAFLRAHAGLRQGGHNVFLYHHPARRGEAMDVDFGVEVAREFEPEPKDDGEVRCVRTPAGRAAVVVHRGPYDKMAVAHDALHAYCAAHGHAIGGMSWEIYGDPTPDPAACETTIVYLLG